jgi:hypothetical protein
MVAIGLVEAALDVGTSRPFPVWETVMEALFQRLFA